MNPYIVKKDLIPNVITNGGQIYLAFVHKNSKNPVRFYDFMPIHNPKKVNFVEKKVKEDITSKLTLSLYFEINQALIKAKTKYNLRKKRYEYNKK